MGSLLSKRRLRREAVKCEAKSRNGHTVTGDDIPAECQPLATAMPGQSPGHTHTC